MPDQLTTLTIGAVNYFSAVSPLPASSTPANKATTGLNSSSQWKFLASGVTHEAPKIPPNRYTGTPKTGKFWKVRYQYAAIPDRTVDVYFDNQNEAVQASLKGAVTLATVFQDNPVHANWEVQDTIQGRKDWTKNKWTGQPDSRPQWHSLLWCEEYNRYADLWFGQSAAEAAQWTPGMSFTLPQLLIPWILQAPLTTPKAPPGYNGLLGTFNVIVSFAPAGVYVPLEVYTGGFVDNTGFHGPGFYPAGEYPATYTWGTGANQSEVTLEWSPYEVGVFAESGVGIIQEGKNVTVPMLAAQKISQETGFTDWIIVWVPDVTAAE